ncbi:MAG: MASE3 domain-containing protein [Candidatus Odinarchaeota archaeon]
MFKDKLELSRGLLPILPVKDVLFILLAIVLLYLTSLYSYLFFHSLVELFSVVVACSIFIIAYNTHKLTDNRYFLFVGNAYLFVAVIDLLHALAYRGMGVFYGTSFDANLSTQLWIAARYLESISLLIAIVRSSTGKSDQKAMFSVYTVITGFLVGYIFLGLFPDCFIEETGLTPFKIASEYVITVILMVTATLLFYRRGAFTERVFRLLILATFTTMLAELSFTLYIDVYGLFNLIGHVFKLVSFYLIYKAIIVTGLVDPYSILFKTLKENESELLRQKQLLILEKHRVESIIENMPEGMLFLTLNGDISLVNRKFQDLYKRTYGKKVPTNGNFLSLSNNLIIRTIREMFVSGSGTPATIELRETGTHLEVTPVVVHFFDGTRFGHLFMTHNITPFIEFDQLREQFVSMVSHELRAPITATSMSLKNLMQYGEKLTAEQKEKLLDLSVKNTNILAEIVEDLLTVSRMEAGKVELDWQHYRLQEVLQKVVSEMEPRIVKKELVLESCCCNSDIDLLGDEKRIGQVFRILVDNAIKYSDQGSAIEIKVTESNHGERNGVVVRVRDQGKGIPEKDLPKLFTRFFRASNVTSMPGTGLGLSIARELVLLHSGEISVTSELGKGSTFTVFLPRYRQNAREISHSSVVSQDI